jgi:hypothetical protein
MQHHRGEHAAACQPHIFSHFFNKYMHQLPNTPNLFSKGGDADFTLTRAGRVIFAATIFWAFVELPFELFDAQTSTAAALLLIDALLTALVALLTLHGVAWARFVFAVLCATSTTVIILSFATDMRFYPVWFVLSLIELITKVGSLFMVCRSESRPL